MPRVIYGLISMNVSDNQRHHWRANQRLSAALLCLWLLITASVPLFADTLNTLTFIGPLGFYMAAQGALLIYLLIIGLYAWRMKKLDQRCGLAESESEEGA